MKENIDSLGNSAIIIVVAIIILMIGGIILFEIKETNYQVYSVANENQTGNPYGYVVNILLDEYGKYVYDDSLVVSFIYSNTSSLCSISNYTVIASNFSVSLHSGYTSYCNCSVNSEGSGCNITYSYTGKTAASNASASGEAGVNQLAEYAPTIALILAAAIVVGIIVNSFRV